MSDQDTPPPMDDDKPEQETPPPMDSQEEEAPASESVIDSIPTEAPSTAGVGLGQGKLPESEEKTMGLLAHILGALTSFVGPIVIWVLKKEDSPFVDDQGKEALNFQITMLIPGVIIMILSALTGGCAGMILYPILWIVNTIFVILGGVEANKGKAYRYPFAVRLVT